MSDPYAQLITLGSIYPQIASPDRYGAKDTGDIASEPAKASYEASAPSCRELPVGDSGFPPDPIDAPPPYSLIAPHYPRASAGRAYGPFAGPPAGRDVPLDEQIVIAGAQGDIEAVLALLKDRFQPIDARDELDQTLLIQAIRTKSLAFVNALIDAGAGYTADALAEAEKTNLTPMVRAVRNIRPFYAPVFDFFSRLMGRALSPLSEPNMLREVVMRRGSRVWVEQPGVGRRPVTWRDVEWAIDSRGSSVVRKNPALLTTALRAMDEQTVCLIKPNDWASALPFLRALNKPQRRAYTNVVPAMVGHLMKTEPDAGLGDIRRLMRWLPPVERMAATDALIMSDPNGLERLLRADRSLANLRNAGAPSPIAQTFARLHSLDAARSRNSDIARLQHSLSVLCNFGAEPTKREFIDAIRNNRVAEVRVYLQQDVSLSDTNVVDEHAGGSMPAGTYARTRGYHALADLLIDARGRFMAEQDRQDRRAGTLKASLNGIALGVTLANAVNTPRHDKPQRG